MTRRRIAAARPFLLSLLVLAGCATNPVTGRHELSLVSSDRELAIGREGFPAVVAEYGVYDDPKIAAHVDSVGQALGRVSHLPALKWTFTVLDDPTVNAFAMPGGYIYITRGILAHLNSEAQLAGVLGHEIGHVTARHTAQRLTQQSLAGLGLTLVSVFSQGFRTYSEAAQQALGLVFLKYSRDDETQADQLGVGYATAAGYDPREIPATYAMLKRVSEQAGQRLPAFLSTHPDPGDRENRTRALANAAAEGKTGLQIRGRAFLTRLDRIVYGRDPRQGYVEENRYYHPQAGFQLDLPAGWKVQDTHASVTVAGPEQHALFELTFVDAGTFSPERYVSDLVTRAKLTDARGANEVIGGWSAWVGRVTAPGQDGAAVTLLATFVRKGPDQMFQLLGRSTTAGDGDEQRILASMRTLRPLTDPGRLAATPDRVSVVRVSAAAAVTDLLPRLGPQAIDANETAILNNLQSDETVLAGQLVKIVTPGRRR